MKERPKRTGIMLAYPTDPGRLKRLGEQFLLQPKINGERCIVEWFAGEPVLISSYGNEFMFLEHIKNKLKLVAEIFGQVPFDGEIYRHGWSREEIDSALRRKVNRSSEVEGLQYHIFDVRTKEPATTRVGFVYGLHLAGLISGEDFPLQFVPTSVVNQTNWMEFASACLTSGFEGAILRKGDSFWEDKRTVSMLKFKPTEEDEYVVLSINEAIDKHGNPKNMVGSFTVKATNVDESFKVGAGKMPHSLRTEIWQKRHLLVGKMLKVKHEPGVTSGGVPLCSVAVDLS